jgi:hypothetical protein
MDDFFGLETRTYGNKTMLLCRVGEIGQLVKGDGGYWVLFMNTGYGDGYYTQEFLLAISNHIANMNKRWNKKVNEYFKEVEDGNQNDGGQTGA